MKRIILTGPKSSGKSNIGARLAELMKVPFYDLDELLEDIFEKENGTRLSFREIFRRHGEEKFREYELKAAEEVVKKDKVLISTGGTTFTIDKLRDILLPDSYVILLKNNPDELWLRTSRKGIPSYLENEIDPKTAFIERVNNVMKVITPIANLSMDTEELSIEEVAQVLDVELDARRVF